MNNLKIKIAPNLILENPIMNSSGMFMYGPEVQNVINFENIGAIVVKGISLNPRYLKKSNRIVEIKKNYSYLNSVGFENMGIDAFINEKLPILKKLNKPIFINVLTDHSQDIFKIVDKVNECDAQLALELNVSCPNIPNKIPLGYDIKNLSQQLEGIKKESRYPIIVKMAPSIENIQIIGKAIEDSGVDAISLINAIPGMVIDIETRKSALWNKSGGLSGPCIHPIALKMVYDLYKAIHIPIIGIGGIHNSETAIAMFIVGASAIQIGTAISFNTNLPNSILNNLKLYCENHHFSSIQDLIGSFIDD